MMLKRKYILVINQDTWYQREIEKCKDWSACLTPDNVRTLLKNGRLPNEVKYEIKESSTEKGATKFFVIVEEPFGQTSDVFRMLYEDVRLEKPKLLKDIENVSLYAFRTASFRGVLIKGETKNYHLVSEQLVHFAKNLKLEKFAAQTTTYFCASVIKVEETDISSNSRKHADRRKPELVYNLLKAHDCHEELWRSDQKTRARSEAFKNIVAEHYESLFEQHPKWWRQINEIRRLYRWVVRENDETLRGYLINRYIGLEKYFRTLFEPHPELWREEKNRRMANEIANNLALPIEKVLAALIKAQKNGDEKFTLGQLRNCVAAAKEIHENPKEKNLIDRFSALSHNLIKNRNDLMHGGVTSLFNENESGESWTSFIDNYIQFILIYPHIQRVFDDALKQEGKLAKIKNKKNATAAAATTGN